MLKNTLRHACVAGLCEGNGQNERLANQDKGACSLPEIVHEIRLAGPWDQRSEDADNWQRTRLPYQIDATTCGHYLRRKFHRPSGLEAESRLVLALHADISLQEIVINQTVIQLTERQDGGANPAVYLFDITAVADDFNTLEVRVPESDEGKSHSLHEARLQILE